MAGRPPSREAPPFGRRLAALRKERGLTQEQFAELLGTTQRAVDYYERNARNPSLDLIQRTADALGVSPAVLIDDDAARPKKRTRPGPKSKLEERFEKVRELPRSEQEIVVRLIDGILASPRH